MEKIISKEFNNNIYTKVDEYNDILEEKIIYYFYNAIENRNIYCLKENNEYIQIKDKELIKKIEEEKELEQPEILFSNYTLLSIIQRIKELRKLSTDEREEFLKQQYEQLKKSNIKDVDYEKIKKAIFRKQGNIYEADDIANFNGFYHVLSQNIYVRKNDPKTNLHETIHKITFASLKSILLPTGFIEGATESLVHKIFKKNFSSSKVYNIGKDDQNKPINKSIVFNNFKGYEESVSLLRQIEVATGMTADKDILETNTDILKRFEKEYGVETLNAIINVSNFAARQNRGILKYVNTDRKIFNDYKAVQNLLLETVFEKDYPENITPETAKEYLEKMKDMEKVRGRVEGDTFFRDYYNEKYERLRENLLVKGYPNIIIDRAIQKYKPVQFNPEKTITRIEYPASFIATLLQEADVSSIEEGDLKTYVVGEKSKLSGNQILVFKGRVIYYDNINIPAACRAIQRLEQLEKDDKDISQSEYTFEYEINGERVKEVTRFETEDGILVIKNEKDEEVVRLKPEPNEESLIKKHDPNIVQEINQILSEQQRNMHRNEFEELIETQEFSVVQQTRKSLGDKLKNMMNIKEENKKRFKRDTNVRE